MSNYAMERKTIGLQTRPTVYSQKMHVLYRKSWYLGLKNVKALENSRKNILRDKNVKHQISRII